MEPEAQPGCDGEEVNNAQGGGEEHVYQGLALKTWFCTCTLHKKIKPDLWCNVMLLDFFNSCFSHPMIANKDTLYLMASAFNQLPWRCARIASQNATRGIDVGIEEIARAVLLNLLHAESIWHPVFFRHKLHVMSSSPWASATGSAFSPQAPNFNQQGSLHHTSRSRNHKPKTDPSEGVSKRSSCNSWVSCDRFWFIFGESNGINILWPWQKWQRHLFQAYPWKHPPGHFQTCLKSCGFLLLQSFSFARGPPLL